MAINPANPAFGAALTLPAQRHTIRLELMALTSAGGILSGGSLGNLPIQGDPSLSLDGYANVMRSMSLDVPLVRLGPAASAYLQAVATPGPGFALLPGDPYSIGQLSTAGSYVNVYWSQQLHDGTYLEQQIAQLRVVRVTMSLATMTATIQLADWTTLVEAAQLVTTYAPVSGSTPLYADQAVYDLVNGALPTGFLGTKDAVGAGGAFVGINTFPGLLGAIQTKAGTAYTGSRIDAINSIMAPASTPVVLRNDYTGRFLVLTDKLSGATPGLNVLTIADSNLGGTLTGYDAEFRDDTGYNAVSVSWSSEDGQTYGQVFLVDSDPASPTYWNGPYGKHPRPDEKVESIVDNAGAIAYATGLLARVKGIQRRATLTMPANPLLEPGDQITVVTPYQLDSSRMVTETALVESIELPLVAGEMTLVVQITSRTVA